MEVLEDEVLDAEAEADELVGMSAGDDMEGASAGTIGTYVPDADRTLPKLAAEKSVSTKRCFFKNNNYS